MSECRHDDLASLGCVDWLAGHADASWRVDGHIDFKKDRHPTLVGGPGRYLQLGVPRGCEGIQTIGHDAGSD